MIDLHCHMLPAIDDGAVDIETSLAMARMAVEDGIQITACTPHIMPGVYENRGPDIRDAIGRLQAALDANGIALKLVTGADVHIAPDLVDGLKSGRVLSLNDSRYFLFEPPHHIAPPRLDQLAFDVMAAGYVPVITHPERLTWIENHYEVFTQMVHAGAWIQITAGALTGRFGRRPKYWSEKLLDDGVVHVLATDAHNLRNRTPVLSEAREMVAARLGEQAATDMVLTRPRLILDNAPPSAAPAPVGVERPRRSRGGMLARLFSTA
ncbi:MAG TPA: CpsB/CapC family capsule biosynthesis tyrosine phosphatase [Caulobacteraceae bacterium]|nr:CpsB/CapC family capsule biosynthesis tyrosine phosphatase [Caulobacteraceae bacterium]